MQICKRCLMPNTRPNSLFKSGVCQACINYGKRKDIDWDERQDKLKDKLSGKRLLVAVSGGKDSHFILKKLKELNCLDNATTITVHDWFTVSKAGKHNLLNIKECFNLPHFDYSVSKSKFIEMTKHWFEKTGEALKWIEGKIYSIPLDFKNNFNFDYVIFGEDSAYEYGTNEAESSEDKYIFMSHYYPWSSTVNLKEASEVGFKHLGYFDDWEREGTIENFEQIDSYGYMVHLWLKYPKFGFQRVTDIVSRRIREGLMTIEEGRDLIKRHDYKLDKIALTDFCYVLGYTEKEFYDIVARFKKSY